MSKADELDQPRVQATWRDLVRLIWEGVKANKLLLVSVWAVALLHAVCNKGMILLGKPFLEAMGLDGDKQDLSQAAPGTWAETSANVYSGSAATTYTYTPVDGKFKK